MLKRKGFILGLEDKAYTGTNIRFLAPVDGKGGAIRITSLHPDAT